MRSRTYKLSGLVFVYNGGHTVNVRESEDGPDVDVFSVGSFAKMEASRDEVMSGIRAYLAARDRYEHGTGR